MLFVMLLCERVGSGRAVCRHFAGTLRRVESTRLQEVGMHTVAQLALWSGGEDPVSLTYLIVFAVCSVSRQMLGTQCAVVVVGL